MQSVPGPAPTLVNFVFCSVLFSVKYIPIQKCLDPIIHPWGGHVLGLGKLMHFTRVFVYDDHALHTKMNLGSQSCLLDVVLAMYLYGKLFKQCYNFIRTKVC